LSGEGNLREEKRVIEWRRKPQREAKAPTVEEETVELGIPKRGRVKLGFPGEVSAANQGESMKIL
jgi:hypothetical protein